MNVDFASAVCEEFCWALEGTVDPALLSPQECWNPIAKTLGEDFDSRVFLRLTHEDVGGLQRAFVDFFETEAISAAQMHSAIERILRRWPVEQ
jgi:hypothetical protein